MRMNRVKAILTARTALCLAAVIVTVLAIWLPFGFTLTGLIEEWGLVSLMDARGPDYVLGLGNITQSVALRPLNQMPFAIANLLSPNSFIAWHLLLMTALVVKGCASSHLVWKVTRSTGFAALMGVLVLVYPAETMQLSFRALHINWALALAMLAGSVFVIAWEADDRKKALLWGLVAAVLILVSILIYEAAFTFVVLPFLVLFAADGWQASLTRLRERVAAVIAWLVSAAAYVVYAWWIGHKVSSYQASLLGGRSIFSIMGEALPKMFSVGAAHAVLGGWIDSVRMAATEFSSYLYLTIAALAIAALVGSAAHATRSVESRSYVSGEPAAKAMRLALAGSALMLAGYAPYLFSAPHLAISQRTFLFASVGAAMFWISVLLGISLVAKPVARLVGVGLIFFGLAAQLVQFNHYVRLTEMQRTLLRGIVENVDGNLGGKTLLIMDGSNYLGHTWMLDSGNLSLALGYFYQHPIGPVQICRTAGMEWQETDSLGRKGICLDTDSDWVFRYQKAPSGPTQPIDASPRDIVLPKAGVLLLRLNADGTADRDARLDGYRKGLLAGSTPADLRFRNILLEPEWTWYKSMFRDARTEAGYKWSFGDWWSLELPIRGTGWREAEWTGSDFSHHAAAWKFSETSTFFFEFAPTDEEYVLRGSFEAFANGHVREKTTILLNGAETPLRWTSGTSFEASVAKNILHRGVNRVDFSAPIDENYFGLSEKLHSFELIPLSRSK